MYDQFSSSFDEYDAPSKKWHGSSKNISSRLSSSSSSYDSKDYKDDGLNNITTDDDVLRMDTRQPINKTSKRFDAENKTTKVKKSHRTTTGDSKEGDDNIVESRVTRNNPAKKNNSSVINDDGDDDDTSFTSSYENEEFEESESKTTTSTTLRSNITTAKEDNKQKNNNMQPLLLFEVGCTIEGRYRGGTKYFPGRIVRIRKNGNFDILYDDGDKEVNIPRHMIRHHPAFGVPSSSTTTTTAAIIDDVNNASSSSSKISDDDNDKCEFDVGDRVEANFRGRGKRWYKGTISQVKRIDSGSSSAPFFDVDYDDGDVDTDLPAKAIRLIPNPTTKDGDKNARISTIIDNGSNNDVVSVVGSQRKKKTTTTTTPSSSSSSSSPSSQSFQIGDKVEAKFRGRGKWFKGVIAKIHIMGRKRGFDVDYDDGDTDTRLSADCLRKIKDNSHSHTTKDITPSIDEQQQSKQQQAEPMALKVGMVIQAKYRGGKKYQPGKVTRVRFNGNYDLVYDDGKKEVNVPRDMIKITNSMDPSDDVEGTDKQQGSLDDTANVQKGTSTIDVGDRVEAKFRGRGSRWYKGIISKVKRRRGDNNANFNDDDDDGLYFDVDYDDGDADFDLPFDCIRKITSSSSPSNNDASTTKATSPKPSKNTRQQLLHNNEDDVAPSSSPPLKVGDVVLAKFRGRGKMYKGKISKIHQNNNSSGGEYAFFDVDYDDGDFDSGLAMEAITKLSSNDNNNKDDDGDDSKGRDTDGASKQQHDDRDDQQQQADVDDATTSRHLESKLLFEAGTKVEARRYHNNGTNKYFPGIIHRVRSNGRLDVLFDDGEREYNLSHDCVRIIGSSSSSAANNDSEELSNDHTTSNFRVGDRVEAKFRGRGNRWFNGIITKIHSSNTIGGGKEHHEFDVLYDDGDNDKCLAIHNIKRIGTDSHSAAEGGNDTPNNNNHHTDEEKNHDNSCRVVKEDDMTKVTNDTLATMGCGDETQLLLHSIGDNVEVPTFGDDKGGSWAKGTIVEVRIMYDVKYPNGNICKNMESNVIRRATHNNNNNNNNNTKKQHEATITTTTMMTTKEQKPSIDDEEEQQQPIIANKLVEFDVGTKIEARYRGKKKYYPGTIMRVSSHEGTQAFDILYDDGGRETNVSREFIRLCCPSSDDGNTITTAIKQQRRSGVDDDDDSNNVNRLGLSNSIYSRASVQRAANRMLSANRSKKNDLSLSSSSGSRKGGGRGGFGSSPSPSSFF